jgi:glycosyltransferase involved in cell wall biosynthesis
MLLWLKVQYKLWWMRKVTYIETQTETAAKGIAKQLSMEPGRIRIIPNAFSPIFNQTKSLGKDSFMSDGNTVNVLTLAAPYPHKNLLIIPKIAAILKDMSDSIRFRFIVTLPIYSDVALQFMKYARKLRVLSCIENLGQVKLKDCPGQYRRAHIVLMPTLLETFSVTYLEAMQMGRPLVTTDIDFAHDICENAALYYDPLSAESAADAILRIATDSTLRCQQILYGSKRLQKFPMPSEKYQMVTEWIREVAEKKKRREEVHNAATAI